MPACLLYPRAPLTLPKGRRQVRFVEDKPGAECQLIGTATGKQSNWFSGQHGEEGGSMRGAAN
ncbi:DUF4156 domain-containing protein, partial [Salmonella enterica subsp. enterica serovar Lubbock]|nr:DUF4156 domain-containing protein [Salmonella enterica subsp. enterica serovar Lubbock]